MDRRQIKTRKAIFNAFIELLSKKSFDKITVEEIINLAEVGRATFYAHFETKDFLLKDLCAELFTHLFESENEIASNKNNLFNCDISDTLFLHLFKHLKRNDNNITKLLVSKSNNLFFDYFKGELKEMITKQVARFIDKKPKIVPDDFWINHITTVFVETLKWWLQNDMRESPEIINEYFFQLI